MRGNVGFLMIAEVPNNDDLIFIMRVCGVKMTSYLMLLILSQLISSKCVKGLEITVCQDKSVKHTDRKAVKIVDVSLGSTINLECHFCHEPDDYQGKVWYFRKRGNRSTAHEINSSLSLETKMYKITISPSHTLQIIKFDPENTGVYFCKYFTDEKSFFTYVLDGVYDVKSQSKIGTATDWHDFQNSVVYSTNHFIRNKKGTESSLFPFEIGFSWENWSSCENYKNENLRRRTGKCRVRPVRNKILEVMVLMAHNMSDKLTAYLMDSYSVSCRSIELNTYYPKISRVIRNISEFTLTESCNLTESSTPIENTKEENYLHNNVTKQIAENGHLNLICPDINSESEVEWYKDNNQLNSSFRNNMAQSLNEPHLTIDTYNALYILHATKAEEGVYSCTVDGRNMQSFCVKVVPKNKFLNQDFIRFSIYLGFVLSLTMTCYCAGICVAWQRRASFADPLNLMNKKRTYCFDERKHLLQE